MATRRGCRRPGSWFLPAALVCVPLFSCVSAASPSSESSIRESTDSIALVTDDGLSLSLARESGEARLGLGSNATTSAARALVRFEEVEESPGAPNLLGPDDAGAWSMPASAMEDGPATSPGRWLRVSSSGPDQPHRAVRLQQPVAQPVIVSGVCRTKVSGNAFGWWGSRPAMVVQGEHDDGTSSPERFAWFGQYEHGAQSNRCVICPDQPLRRMRLRLTSPPGNSTAWYRNIEVHPARYQVETLRAPIERIDHVIHQAFSLRGMSLRGLVRLLAAAERLEIECRVESTTDTDRALSAWFVLPVDAVGGRWHDDPRRFRDIEFGKTYRAESWYGAGRDGFSSRYPVACVETAGGAAVALAVPPDEPRVYQTEYDARTRQFRVRFDFGMSPDAGAWGNRASFRVVVFRPGDGFRGAIERYHRIYGWAFRNRVARQGLWLPFVSPRAISGGWEDFHFRFLESVGDMGFASREGMLSLRYVEPWLHHQEFPAAIAPPEVHGAVDPIASLGLARRIAGGQADRALPPEMRQRHASYPGSCIEDKWGVPQGYLFRNPAGGRNENMMIVNPNDRLPAPPGTDVSSGAYDRLQVEDTSRVARQWYIDGWTLGRVAAHVCGEIDAVKPAEGRLAMRLDPVQGQWYFEQHLRGIRQIVRPDHPGTSPLTLSYQCRAQDVPVTGSLMTWNIGLWHADGTLWHHSFPIAAPGKEWQTRSHTVTPTTVPIAVSVEVSSPVWQPDPTVLWLDDVKLLKDSATAPRNLLANGGFERAELLPCRLDGVYLDTMECYEGNLNYRRDHWKWTEEPLTFDCARQPAMHQVFSHVAFARHLSQWLRARDMIAFGNCVPRTPFAAPWLEALGTELNWKEGGHWAPWPDAEFLFARVMSRGKPYCILQYADLSAEEQERYIRRCMFYGVLPSNQASPTGGWYWTNPAGVERHRSLFARYLPVLIKVAEAGWQPVTMARSDSDSVWVERFGEGRTTYFTVFNPGNGPASARITLDPRLQIGRQALADVLNGTPATLQTAGNRSSFDVKLESEGVGVLRVEGGKP